MTATSPEYPAPGTIPPAYTAPTVPVAPASAASAASPAASPAGQPPWYRRAWVLAVGAVLIAVLSFASGFVAGNATALFNRLGGPGTNIDGPRFPDGVRPGDGQLPQFPGDATQEGDGT